MHDTIRLGLTVAVAVAIALAGVPAMGAAATSATPPAEPSLYVALDADGDATVTATYAYDLTDDAERQTFAALETNDTARTELARDVAGNFRPVANATATATGRDVTLGAPTASVRTTGDTGLVAVSVPWQHLAAVEGDRLVLTEPFASGYDPDRPLVVHVPEGYAVEATPSPDATADQQVRWEAGADLAGFELTAEPSTSASGPGFGVVAALAAVLAAGALLARRRS